MKKTRKVLLLVLTMVVFLSIKAEVLAANSLERSYYTVVSGTATKLGTQESENLKGNIYLEEWEVPKEMVLSEDVVEVLLKSSNVGELPITVDELDYSTLKKLAAEAAEEKLSKDEPIYQGYSRLGLKEAKEGYTFGIVVNETNGDECIVTGYYAEIHNKAIYKIELLCKKSSYSEIFNRIKVREDNYNSKSLDNSDSDETEEQPTPPSPPTTPTPPAPPTPPTPPPPSGGPIDDDPTPPTPVIPGPAEG